MARKNAVRRPLMKSVAKAATPKQLNLDFKGCAPMPVKACAKAPRIRKAPASSDIPDKPEA
jgi:hypothetical protein